MNIDFISCDIDFIDSSLVSEIKKKAIPIIAWTVNSEKKKEKANSIASNIIFEKIRP